MIMIILRDYKYHPRVEALPKEQHFAVLVESGFRYDDGYGDSRSGPSYTNHEELQYISFENEAALGKWVLENQKQKFRVIQVSPVNFEVKTTFSLAK
jgi:hypothetical protein